MGKTIPSFRQLFEIEKLNWSTFQKLLPSKKDKQAFDEIFENAKLYTSYLGNASNPIVLESINLSHNCLQTAFMTKQISIILFSFCFHTRD